MIPIRKFVHLFFIISETIIGLFLFTTFIIYVTLNKYELIWIASKFKTVVTIIENNMKNICPLLNINKNFINSIYYKNYSFFFNHSTRDNCEQNYKKCGILDTYGNIMCIPIKDTCPINEIIIDLKEKSNEYIEKGYYSISTSKLPEKYNLYYTNKSIDKKIVVHLIISDDKPRYINYNNFIFDLFIYNK